VEQAAAVGGDMLVVAGAGAEEVAERVQRKSLLQRGIIHATRSTNTPWGRIEQHLYFSQR
jgi:hypothetical protein